MLLALILSSAPTRALDDGINLQISPLPILLSTDPGKTVSSELRIRNAGTKSEKLKVTLRTFKAQGNKGNVVLQDRGPTDQHFDWVSFDRPTFEAPPNVWQTVNMKIKVPKTAAFGYYYAVQFERATPVKAQPGQSAVEGAIAIFVLLEANNPNAKRTAEIASFTATKKFYEFLPADFDVVIKNTGNVHISPGGTVYIQRGNDDKDPITAIPLNPHGGYVLPKSNRTFKVSWDDGFPVYVPKTKDGLEVKGKNGEVERELKWDFSQVPDLRVGSYTAKLVTVYFWVVPWRIVGGGVVIALFVAIGLGSTGRGMWRRWRKK